MKNETKWSRLFDVFNVIFFTLLSIAFLYPVVYIISLSLSEAKAITEGQVFLYPVGFNTEAYKYVFRDDTTMKSVIFTATFTIAGILCSLAATALTAYPLSRRSLKGKNFIMNAIVFTMYFSGGMIPTYITIKSLGLFNTMWSLILPSLIDTFLLIIMINFMRELPYELEESAKVEGCSNFGIFLKVYLPLCIPVLATLTIFYAVQYWNTFMPALLYIQDRDKMALQVKLYTVLSAFSNSLDTTSVAAASDAATGAKVIAENVKSATTVVAVLPILIVYPMLQKYFVKGVAIGAVKG